MKLLISGTIFTTILLFSGTAHADDKDVGYCGAYHLMLKNYDYVKRVALKAQDIPTMQRYARELIDIAQTDPNRALKRGMMACMSLGLKV